MKTHSQGHGQSQSQPRAHPHSPSSGALEEKITHLTEEAAKTANRFKVPIVVVLVAVVAIVAVSGLVSTISRQQDAERSEKLYQLFARDDAQIRTEAPAIQKEFEGTRIEPAFVSLYARWLFEQNQPGDRAQALALVAAARARHPQSLILELAGGELEQVHAADEGFALPPIPEPSPPPTSAAPGGATVVTPPVVVAPVPPESPAPAPGESAPPPAGASEGEAAPPPAPGQPPGSGGR